MNEVIYKYQLEVTDTQLIHLPSDAEILTVQTQPEPGLMGERIGEKVCLWAKLRADTPESTATVVTRTIEIFGTGHPIKPGNRKYLGTFMLRGGSFVGHAFEKLN